MKRLTLSLLIISSLFSCKKDNAPVKTSETINYNIYDLNQIPYVQIINETSKSSQTNYATDQMYYDRNGTDTWELAGNFVANKGDDIKVYIPLAGNTNPSLLTFYFQAIQVLWTSDAKNNAIAEFIVK